jgi:hypothetical protein
MAETPMIPMPDPIVEDSAMVMIFYKGKDGKKKSFSTCLCTEDAEEIQRLAEKKTKDMGLLLDAILRKKGNADG